MSNKSKIASLKTSFAAALMIGAGAISADAQVYNMGGRGGNTGQDYSYLELPYPNGEIRRVLYPYNIDYGSSATDAEKQQVRERITPILRDYVTNVMPQMPAIYEQDFSFVISILSYSLGVDETTFCKDVGYDCQFVAVRKTDIDPNRFANLEHELNTPYGRSGYDIVPSAMSLDEGDIDDINELLARLRVNYPNDQRYQIPDYTYDHLVEMRKELAERLAYTMLMFASDLVTGNINPQRVNDDVQDYLSAISRILAEPENINMRNYIDAAGYNSKMPEYIDAVLETKYGLTEHKRNELYSMIFKTRDNYDYRPLPHEDDFIAQRDVIGAPKP